MLPSTWSGVVPYDSSGVPYNSHDFAKKGGTDVPPRRYSGPLPDSGR